MTHPIDPQSTLSEDEIVYFLLNTPDFFERKAELLSSVQLSSPHSKRAVSLQERQAEMLRDKIKLLERKLVDLIRLGDDNVAIAGKLQRWTRRLLQTDNARELPDCVVSGLGEEFDLPQVAISLWDLAPAYAQEAFAQGVNDNLRALASSLTEPYCGPNTGFEAANWLDQPALAQSLAIIPLRIGLGSAFGLLVLASPDPKRFQPDMGTEFLQQIAALASAALSRLR